MFINHLNNTIYLTAQQPVHSSKLEMITVMVFLSVLRHIIFVT